MPENNNGGESFSKRLIRARELYRTGDWNAAATLYHQLIDEAPKYHMSSYELWGELAWSYYHLKRYESTLICLKQVTEKSPDYPKMADVYRLSAQCQAFLGRTKLALESWQKALKIIPDGDPLKKEVEFEIAQVHFQRGEFSIAKKYFDELSDYFKYETDDAKAANYLYQFGFTEYYLRNYVNAEKYFEEMFHLAKDDAAKALALYGKAFIQFNDSRYEALIGTVEEILGLNPEFQDKESLAYFMCVSYKSLNDRIKFDMFFNELKKNYPEGRYSEYYDDLQKW
jgi:tetratricopeptide (TPR) repeat protein